MSRVKPRLIALEVDGVDRSDEVSKSIITSRPASDGFRSLASSRGAEDREYMLEMTIAQNHASGTLWDLIWTGAGTYVDGIYAPYGNETASETQPHYSFTANVSEPDGDFLGAESNRATNAVAVIEVAWELSEKPVRIPEEL